MAAIAIYKRVAGTLEAPIGDEVVTMDIETGDCFGFNDVAASVWRALADPKSFDELRAALLAEYDVSEKQCSIELQALLDDLVEKKLIVAD